MSSVKADRVFGKTRFPDECSLPFLLAILCGLIVVVGCDGPIEVTLVRGTVSYRGKPLDHGSLRFYGESNHPLSSVLNSDGTYEVQLPPGDYRVSVSSPPQAPANLDPTDDTPPRPTRDTLPARFSQIEKSGLKLNVEFQQEPLTWEIELK